MSCVEGVCLGRCQKKRLAFYWNGMQPDLTDASAEGIFTGSLHRGS